MLETKQPPTIKQNLNKLWYLGKDQYDTRYYLSAPRWDCDWYWGFGYITSKDSY